MPRLRVSVTRRIDTSDFPSGNEMVGLLNPSPRMVVCPGKCSAPHCKKRCCAVLPKGHKHYHRCIRHFDRMMQNRAKKRKK